MTKNAKARPCHVVLERLSAYLDGDLPAADCRKVEAHAATCPRCTEVLEDFRKATGLCRHAGERPLPAGVRKIAREHVRQLLARRPGR